MQKTSNPRTPKKGSPNSIKLSLFRHTCATWCFRYQISPRKKNSQQFPQHTQSKISDKFTTTQQTSRSIKWKLIAPFRSTFCGAFWKSIRARAFYEWNYLSKSRSKRVETGGPPSPLPNWSTNKSRFDLSSLPVSIGLGGNSLYFTVRQTFARLFLLCVINQLEEFRFLARTVFSSWRRRRRSSPKQIKLAKLIGFRSLRGPAAATLLVVGDDRGLFWKVFRGWGM